MLLAVTVWLATILLTYLVRPGSEQAWTFLTFLTPFITAIIAAYIGVQGWIDKQMQSVKFKVQSEEYRIKNADANANADGTGRDTRPPDNGGQGGQDKK